MKNIRQIIASGLVGMLLSACSMQQQQQQQVTPEADVPAAPEPKKKDQPRANAPKKEALAEESAAPEGTEAVAPTPEQQAAAEHILSQSADDADDADDAPQGESPAPVAAEEVVETPAPPAGIPGRRALRMGQYAPPEEAASTGAASAPRPNRAEQHGFRSPSLPSGLPMDIHGKLTGQGNN